MKIKRMATMAIATALFGVQLSSASAFAVNPYNIEYSGGTPLGSGNVIIEPNLLDYATPLLKTEVVSTTPAQPEMWEEGYIKDSEICKPAFFYTAHAGMLLQAMHQQNRSFTISNGQYKADVEILGETLEDLSDGDYAISILPNSNYIYVGWRIFSDANCESVKSEISSLPYSGGKIFLELKSTLYKEGSTTPLVLNNMAFGITDIDAAQSYKILNEGNELNAENMYALSAESLQPGPDVTLRNMFVREGGYIYSQYDPVSNDHIMTSGISNIYLPISSRTQSDGVHFVFGFAGSAASGIEYYTAKHKVQYDTDENGAITGITNEERLDGEYASGSSYKAKDSYRFSHWIADVNVFLEDGTEIKAGEPITSEQIKKVIVDRDIKFTAIFEADIKVPNTGTSTMETNAVGVTLSIFGILLGALFLRSLPRLTHKKIDFDK